MGAVQEGVVKHPTQVGFTSKAWVEYFNSCKSRSDEDQRVFDSGLWFFERFEAVRSKLSKFPDPALDRDKIKCMYVGMVNRDYAIIDNVSQDDLLSEEDKIITTGEMIERRLPIGPGGYPVRVIDVIESEVSGIRYPLSKTFRAGMEPASSPYQHPSDLQTLHNLLARVNLAILYDNLSGYWEECLWNGWSITVDNKKDAIVPPASNVHISKIIGQHRSDTLLMELAWRSIMLWRTLPPELKEIELKRLRVTRVNRTKTKCEIKLGHSEDSPFPPLSLVVALAAEELYWNEILVQPLPRIENVTIREILVAWDILTTLGAVLKEDIPKDTEVKTIDKLIQFAPTFPKSELINAVRKATVLSESKASSIVNLFIFHGDVRTDPWFRPVIPLSEERCTVLIPALTVPNLVRSIESWMKAGGIDLSERGDAFEKYIRERVQDALAKSRHMSKSFVNTKSQKISANGQREEIDFIWIIGSKIILGEVKCIVYPASPREVYRYFEVLKRATIQARRKSDFVSANLEKVLGVLNIEPRADYSSFVVQPLVIINLALGAGIPLNGVPIADQYILLKYIDGKQDFCVSTTSEGDSKPLFEKIYYSSEEESESNIIPYLLNPPLFSLLSNMIASQEIQLLPLEKEEKSRVIIRLYVKEPNMKK